MTQMISIVRRFWLLLGMALFILLPSAPVSAQDHIPEFKMGPIAPITMSPLPWVSPVAPLGGWPDWIATSGSTTAVDLTAALTDKSRISFTLNHCPYPWQLNPGAGIHL